MSPTHGEYIYARQLRKRILVFIREEVMTDYQRYREAIDANAKDAVKAEKALFLPEHISFQSLQFVQDVKTTSPIPWIRTFRNVTQIKRELHKQILNELVTGFQLNHAASIQSLLQRLEDATEHLPKEERLKVLQAAGLTKELVQEYESTKSKVMEQTKVIDERTRAIDKLAGELKEAKTTAAESDHRKATIDALKAEVGSLRKDRANLEARLEALSDEKVSVASGSIGAQVPIDVTNFTGGITSGFSGYSGYPAFTLPPATCSLCSATLDFSKSRKCLNCTREYCWSCWPLTALAQDRCPECSKFPRR